jgi:type VI secretion system protein ImpE
MRAQDLYQAGQLGEALQGAVEEVKKHPADTAKRGFLSELLCFAGELERADKQLDALGQQEPGVMVTIALFRHLIRAEQARQQFYKEGRLPEFLGKPSPVLQLHLEASIRLREGQEPEAIRLLAQAEEQRPHTSGTCNGKPFDDLRDLDDLTSAFFEVLTSNGKYYWVGMDQVELLELRKPTRPRDLLWQRAHMVVHEGPDGEVYLPTLYVGSDVDKDERIRLGRVTDWRGGDGNLVRGLGQRTFLVGEDSLPILQLENLTFNRV